MTRLDQASIVMLMFIGASGAWLVIAAICAYYFGKDKENTHE